MTSASRNSELSSKIVIAALLRLRCRESRRSEHGVFFRTPRGKTLPPLPSQKDRDVHMNAIARIKKILGDEGINFWAGMEGAVQDEKKALSKCAQGNHTDRKVVNSRWICMKCVTDLGPYIDPKKPLTAKLGDIAKRPLSPPAPPERLPYVPAGPIQEVINKNSIKITARMKPEKTGTIIWKIPPEEKIRFIREIRAIWKSASPGAKYKALKQACIDRGRKYGDYYNWACDLIACGYDLDSIPDEATKIFDTRSDYDRDKRIGEWKKSFKHRQKVIWKEGFCDQRTLAKALTTSRDTLKRMEDEGKIVRVDTRYGRLYQASRLDEYRELLNQRFNTKYSAAGKLASHSHNPPKEGTQPMKDSKELLEKIDKLMKAGDVAGLADALDQNGLKMSDIARLRKEADRPRTTEERLDRIEKMMEKLVKELGSDL